MTDRRLFPANARVADRSLAGQVTDRQIVEGRPATISQPVVNLLAEPGGGLDRQLLFGAAIEVFEVHNGYAFVRHLADGYVGYIGAKQFRDPVAATHWVTTNAAQLYPQSTIKSVPFMTLPYQAQVAVQSARRGFAKLATGGFIPEQLIAPIDQQSIDPVAVAERFLGAPYLWGGNSIWGIDCSGLIQAAFRGCGVACPADSDQQAAALGAELGVEEPLQRGDLLFWRGHVGIMQTPEVLLHANAHHMRVTSEPLSEVVGRIQEVEGKPILVRRRV